MPAVASPPPSNPTVEEVKDENHLENNGEKSNGSQKLFSWPELCSQHEKVLSSHLTLLNAAGDKVPSDGDAAHMISSMTATTHKLMTQLKVLKRKMLNQPVYNQTFFQGPHTQSATPPNDHESAPRDRKKRARLSKSAVEAEVDPTDPVHTGTSQPQKRKRLNEALPAGNQDLRDVIPVSNETEDISEEVQRRLKIKEERRRQRNSKPQQAQPVKRKRESFESVPNTPAFNPRKRARVDSDEKTHSPVPRNEITKRRTDDDGYASNSASDGRRGAKRHKQALSSRGS